VLSRLDATTWLMASLLYGSGLRLMECLRLRVKDVEPGHLQLTVRDGKGRKDRITVLPERLCEPLAVHLEKTRAVHGSDLAKGFGRRVSRVTTDPSSSPGRSGAGFASKGPRRCTSSPAAAGRTHTTRASTRCFATVVLIAGCSTPCRRRERSSSSGSTSTTKSVRTAHWAIGRQLISQLRTSDHWGKLHDTHNPNIQTGLVILGLTLDCARGLYSLSSAAATGAAPANAGARLVESSAPRAMRRENMISCAVGVAHRRAGIRAPARALCSGAGRRYARPPLLIAVPVPCRR